MQLAIHIRNKALVGNASRPLLVRLEHIVVSYISSGALSVALFDLPIVPNTLSTSGKRRMI